MEESGLTQERVKQLFDYRNGKLFWKHRPVSDFNSAREWKIINTLYAGKEAGTYANGGYRVVKTKEFRVRVHRLVWIYFYGEPPNREIDHINGNPEDNRISNLRIVTATENRRNMARPKNNTSGVIGVSYRANRKKWRAYIMIDNRQITLGHYKKKEEAILARKRAEEEIGFHPNHGREPQALSA